jgi:hypothetical protein
MMFTRSREAAKRVIHAEARRRGGCVARGALPRIIANDHETALTGEKKTRANGAIMPASAPRLRASA